MNAHRVSADQADAGLQPERTVLAWRRTALALTVGAFVALRLLPELIGRWVIIPAGLGLLLAITTLLSAQLRYSHHRLHLAHGRQAVVGPVLMILMAATALTLGITALGFAVWRFLG